jgi:hypothetical protein
LLAYVFSEQPRCIKNLPAPANRVEGINIKIAFLHTEDFFTSQLLQHVRTTLAHHEVVEWIGGKDAPAFDFDVLLAMGNVGRELLLDQPKLPSFPIALLHLGPMTNLYQSHHGSSLSLPCA